MLAHPARAHPSSVNRTYIARTFALMGIYVLINFATILGFFKDIEGQSIGWVIAAALTLPVAGQILATLRLMAQSDEFVRAIVAKCFILAAGITMTVWSAWGYGEAYAAAPHLPNWLIYPTFWAMYALVSPFVRTSN